MVIAGASKKKEKNRKNKNKGFSFADVGDVFSPSADEVKDEEAEKEEEEEEKEEKAREEDVNARKPTGAKKKKRRGKKTARETPEPELKSPDENIDDVIREVCGDDLRETDEPGFPISDFSVRSLFHIEHKNLNPDNEMKKIFGSKVGAGNNSSKPGPEDGGDFNRLL